MPVDSLLTVEQVAAILGVRKSWVYERTRHGEIPCVKLGGLLRFDPKDLPRWVEAHKRGVSKNDSESRLAERHAGQSRARGRRPRVSAENGDRGSESAHALRIINSC
jgi:excisionase family DNA binding protein